MNCKITLILVMFVAMTYVQAQLPSSGVPCSEKKIIVDTHNELRKKLANDEVSGQPKAGNLQKIVWDDQLEAIAQNYANKMDFNHNKERVDERFYVGENLYLFMEINTNQTWKSAVEGWFDEHKKYTYVPLVSDPLTGHYTQVVWANTMYIGCGFAYNTAVEYYNKLYVCNYGPGGNVEGEYPYIIGNGCEDLCCTYQCSKLYGKKCEYIV